MARMDLRYPVLVGFQLLVKFTFIDILYQNQHLLHRFFQFEPTTKIPPPLGNTRTSDLEINETVLYRKPRVPSNSIVKNSKCFNKSELTLIDYIEKFTKPYF